MTDEEKRAADRLKTPVTTLGLALQRMEDARSDKERRAFFEMAKRGQKELNRAVEEVLEASRTERNKKEEEE